MIKHVSWKVLRKRRSRFVLVVSLLLLVLQLTPLTSNRSTDVYERDVLSQSDVVSQPASEALEQLAVKGRAAKTDYSRGQFSNGWAQISGCDVRNLILQRDLQNILVSSDGCIVLSGTLDDPYTGLTIEFVRGTDSSDKVQIDHVVALSDAWQKGAQQIDESLRLRFANDSLNLLAVDGSSNQNKGDGDSATWLPDNKPYRCRYVARQIAVKKKYELWVTSAEKAAMKRVLNSCPDQPLPIEIL